MQGPRADGMPPVPVVSGYLSRGRAPDGPRAGGRPGRWELELQELMVCPGRPEYK
jgi:hypothetical protein